jgi:hypothetical protein
MRRLDSPCVTDGSNMHRARERRQPFVDQESGGLSPWAVAADPRRSTARLLIPTVRSRFGSCVDPPATPTAACRHRPYDQGRGFRLWLRVVRPTARTAKTGLVADCGLARHAPRLAALPPTSSQCERTHIESVSRPVLRRVREPQPLTAGSRPSAARGAPQAGVLRVRLAAPTLASAPVPRSEAD